MKRDPSFFDAYRQLADVHEYLYAVKGYDPRPPGLPWLKPLWESSRPGCDRMLPKLVWRAEQISTSGRRDYAGALAQLEIAW